MSVRSAQELAAADPENAIEIADRVWWVGHYLEGDPFQCHCYLIEHGDQSVLLDPGSRLTFRHTIRKIEQVTSFSNVRYFVLHHQDPDITGAMPIVDELVSRDDAVVVSHWRAHALLKHYDLDMPFWLVEDNEWKLDLGGRELQFVFTPYMHFPGAFCTFDHSTGVLFSSDIFGGFTSDWALVAQDEGHFEALRPFHEHYMPSRDVMIYGLDQLQKLPLELIAPQHGSLIPKHLIGFMTDSLRSLDCGLYLMAKDNTDIQRLSRLNKMLRDVMDSIILYRAFKDVAESVLALVQDLLPARSLEFYSTASKNGEALHLSPQSRYRGERVPMPTMVSELIGLDRASLIERQGRVFLQREIETARGPCPALLLPLFKPDEQRVSALAVIHLEEPLEVSDETEGMLAPISTPLEVAVERERIYRMLEMERQEIYERSIRDPLTGLYSRVFMQETIGRWMTVHDRNSEAAIAVVLFDIDYFKRINDRFGHIAGDEALKRVSGVIRQQLRTSDLAVRFGGEEFAVFLNGASVAHASAIAERIRAEVAQVQFDGAMAQESITISAGIAVREQNEPLNALISRADANLYEAKGSGRNRVVCDPPPPPSS